MSQQGKRLVKKEQRELAPLIAVALILLGLSVASLILPDGVFSANENRYLQQKPKLTLRTVMNGEFTADAEDYTADQIALRDFWMGSKSTLQRLTGKRDIGGVYLGKDGYYFAKVTEDDFDRARFEKNVGCVSEFFSENGDKDCRIMLVPAPDTVLTDKLPKNAETYDRAACDAYLADIFMGDAILPYAALFEAAETQQVYYRTDHHWTSEGALAAYKLWAQSTGHTARSYNLETVTESFRGTLHSKVLLPDSVYDSIATDQSVTIRSMTCDEETMTSLYVLSALDAKDKYEVFMGGNYAKAVIDTGNDTGRSLLLIKDSFANSFLPFIAADYDTITVLDLRYFREDVQALAKEHTDILVLYEMTNFASDSNLYKLNLTK